LLGGTFVFIFALGIRNENAFFYAFYTATGGACVFLLWATRNAFSMKQFSFNSRIARIMLNYGFWVQLNNFFQILNYRFTLLLLDYYWGKKTVGYFSAALQLAEAIWIIAKSLATVQYARIAANKSKEFAVDLTMLMSKSSFVFSMGAALVLILLPESFIGYCLGKDFTNVKEPMMYLLPGILFFSISLIYCHYFSGLGKFFYNTAGSLISLLIIVVVSLATVPFYGSNAAALSNSAGLFGMFVFNVVILVRNEQIPVARLIPAKNDLKKAGSVMRDFLSKN
jgi:O-antigen/teichoic acid export membrane protein